jgi:galactose mutarotase-like enzyme
MIETQMPSERKDGFKIETFTTPEGNEISCCPERGGIIISIKIKGKEILHQDIKAVQEAGTNPNAGIPPLFPNSGPIPDEQKLDNPELANLKQHGFAREEKWLYEKTAEGINMTLKANSETRKVYPYNFKLSLIGKFEPDSSFTIVQQIENLEESKDMPVASGLHPYLEVLSGLKGDIEFNFPGGEFVKENTDKWANGEVIKAINIDNPNVPMQVKIPGLGILVFTISSEYKRVWVWSQQGKDFICIEPVMRDAGGIITDPEIIKPTQKYSASFNIRLIPE